ARAAKQRSREREIAVCRAGVLDRSPDECSTDEMYQVLREEISRLPPAYRSAVRACYVEGKSQTQAAAHLCVSETTIRGRLARARKLLKRKLTLRGVYPSGVLYGLGSSHLGDSLIPRGTIQAVARAAVCFLDHVRRAHGIREMPAGAPING